MPFELEGGNVHGGTINDVGGNQVNLTTINICCDSCSAHSPRPTAMGPPMGPPMGPLSGPPIGPLFGPLFGLPMESMMVGSAAPVQWLRRLIGRSYHFNDVNQGEKTSFAYVL